MAFNKKVSSLLSSKINNTKNLFVQEGLKSSSETVSENGALKYSTSGNDFVDDFASLSKYKAARSFEEVSQTMQILYNQNPIDTVKMAIYVRLITRKCQIIKGEKQAETLEDVQRGQGLRNEGIMRMLWLAIHHPNVFKVNLPLFIAAGSWKDIITMMNLDLQYHGWNERQLDWAFLSKVFKAGLLNPNTSQLIRKYLPTIRTDAKCTTLESQADTLIGRWLAQQFFSEDAKFTAYKKYRQLKSKGTAHQWQQLISKQLYTELNFDKIAGRALALLVGSKFLKNHKLIEKYSEWIKNKSTEKYTGFVFELFKPLDYYHNWRYDISTIEPHVKETINAQFAHLVQTGKEGVNCNSELLVVRDTSGSMTFEVPGCGMSSFAVAKAMALYFSEFLTGYFANTFAEFNVDCKLHQWKGETPVDKWINDKCYNIGNTNFQSVIDLFVKLRKKGIPESEFPKGILCISDGEMDDCGESTNFNTALNTLRNAGFSKEYVDNFRIILWDIPNDCYGKPTTKFEDFADAPNFFYMSGFDPSAISFIMNGTEFKRTPRNAEELFKVAMDQELLNRVYIPKK